MFEDKKFLPGEIITDEQDFINGHGTQKTHDQIRSTLFGTPILINKLITVSPFFELRYNPEVGDVVIGRVTEITKKWKIEMNCKFESSLQLSSVFLVEQRRKLESDEMKMREIFGIGDLLVAEVQKVNKSNTVSLHTRNEKYGKLGVGKLVTMLPFQMPKNEYFLENEKLRIIFGANGWVFVENKSVEPFLVYKILNYLEICKYEETKVEIQKIKNMMKI